jgi:type III pantothenate kinase
MESRLRLIVVDVGNTSTAVGLWVDGKVSLVSHIDGDIREAFAAVSSLAARCKGGVRIAYVSVVPAKDRKFASFFKKAGFDWHQIGWKDFPLGLDYPSPETIGADRLADAVGAVERYGAPVIVMDFGTALTAAAVTEDRIWRGGVIAPGFPLMRDYLFERTAKLPRMELGTGKVPKIGRSTEEAMRFGALVGFRGMVREIVSELKRNFKCEFKLVATGGFAKWALKGAGMPFVIDPTLTLYGAGLISERRNVNGGEVVV